MTNEEDLQQAQEDIEAVEFSMNMAIDNPGMYSIDEMKELIKRYEGSSTLVDEVVRKDFQNMPPALQQKMKEMLLSSSVSKDVWADIFGNDWAIGE